MRQGKVDRRLQVGRALIIVMGISFMAVAVVAATNPLPMEEGYLGRSFGEIRATDPQLGNVIWHDYVAFGTLLFGVSFLIVYLAWRGLRRSSREAWLSILVLAVTILAFLVLAHVPIGNTSFAHFGIPTILALLLISGLAVSAKPVFRETAQGPLAA